MLLVDKTRDSRLPENLPGVAGIRRKVPGNHRDLPVAVSSGTDQFMDFPCHCPQLLLRVYHHTDGKFIIRRSLPLFFVITVQMLLQKIQRASLSEPAVLPPPGPNLRKDLAVYLLGTVQKLPHHLFAGKKQILRTTSAHRILPLVHRHRHQKPGTQRHQFLQYFQLDRCKAYKSVKQDFTGPDLLRLFQLCGQNLKNPFRRHITVP